MTFPSLLHSRSSVDNLHLAQEAHWIPSDSEVGAECSLWEAKSSQVSQSPSKVPFTVATPFYFPPSLNNAGSAHLQPPDFVTSTPPRTAFELQLPSPNSKYSPASPQTASPGSELSLESTTSSAYDDPFHWDAVLASLPSSPRCFPVFAAAVDEPLTVRSSTPPVPSVAQCHVIDTRSPERDSMRSTASPAVIPTIVVLNPESVMVPAQASVSSIVGLYGDQRESTQIAAWEVPAPESQTPEDELEQDLDEDDTDGEDSSPESEFEIVAVPALKVRLDTIFETDDVDVANSFGSLMVRFLLRQPLFPLTVHIQTLGSIAFGDARISAAKEQTSTESLASGRAFSSSSSTTEPSIDVISVFSSGQIIQSNPKPSASSSFASTAKLFYTQSGTSISGESASSCRPTASGSESDCPWLFCVEDGKILEVPRSTSVHGGGEFADKLARFPNVPKSPQLTPLPSPFASPPPSPSPANPYFISGSLLTLDIPKKKPSGTTTIDIPDTGSLLYPYWERDTVGSPPTLSPGMSTPYRPMTSAGPSSIAEISFGELGVDLGLSGNFGSLGSDSLPTDSSSSSGCGTRLSTAQNATPSCGRHVRFESADFRTSDTPAGSKRRSPRYMRPPLNRSKTRRIEKAKDWRNSSDASTALVGASGIDCDHLPSSFSSGSISKRGPRWQRGRFFVAIGRVRRGIRGCLSLQEEENFGSTVWATERDYWDDHLPKDESKRSDDSMRGGDGGALLRRIRRYTQ